MFILVLGSGASFGIEVAAYMVSQFVRHKKTS